MNIEKIKNANTKYIGKNVIYYEEIGSTQDEIKKLAMENVENGTIVVTDNQTAGRGTKGRAWFSQKSKNIIMSFMFYPNCKIKKLDGITIKIAEAIEEAISDLYGYKLFIKEPNDLMLNGKKICGILTQSTTINDNVNYVLVGIGFDVNQTEFEREIENVATSLKKEYGKEFERENIICKILEKIEESIEKMK